MKITKNNKLIADKVCDCKSWKSFFGLRFRAGFKPFNAFLIHMLPGSVLDSFFVHFNFTAVWLTAQGKVLKVEKCTPNHFYAQVKSQNLVLELPANNKAGIKIGDTLFFQTAK